MSVGWSNVSVELASPVTPGLPSVISTLPSLLNLMTVWPLPFSATVSDTQTLPSRSTWKPCGSFTVPAPNLVCKLPLASNFMIGSSVEPRQFCAAQRSNVHRLLPSGSISIPMVEPHFRSGGSFAQFSCSWYGLGKALGSLAWANMRSPERATSAVMPTPSSNVTQLAVLMQSSLVASWSKRSCRRSEATSVWRAGGGAICIYFGRLLLSHPIPELQPRISLSHALAFPP